MKLANSLLILLLASQSCISNDKKSEGESSEVTANLPEKEATQDLSKYDKAYFASGCFWCVEAIFESVKGVKEVISGYAGGGELNPTYEQVSYGRTTHAEAVEVYYNPKEVSFETLVRVFFGSHDPTTLNRQGPDRGAQYRSIAFYQNEKEEKTIKEYMVQLEKEKFFDKPIVTQVVAFEIFYKAEDYHQDFERRNPNQSYVKAVSVPRLKRFQKLYPELLKEQAH